MLAVSLAGSIAGSSAYPFMGIWAIKELHAAQTKLAFTYLIGAGLSLMIGYAAASIPAAVRLGVAMPLMGVPFLLLNVDGSPPVIAFVILLFVLGEMLWVPTSQAVVAALAPADIRGAYMGAFGSTWSVGWALTPFLGLQVRSAYGDATMWMCVAAVGVIAGILGIVAARGHDGDPAAVGSPA